MPRHESIGHRSHVAGLAAALESLCGIIAPPFVGWLTATTDLGDSAGALTGAASNGVACALLFKLRAAGLLTLTSGEGGEGGEGGKLAKQS